MIINQSGGGKFQLLFAVLHGAVFKKGGLHKNVVNLIFSKAQLSRAKARKPLTRQDYTIICLTLG